MEGLRHGRGADAGAGVTSISTASPSVNVGTAILSVSTPGTAFLPSTVDAVALARDIDDYLADLVKVQPDRFGFFATIPLPHIAESIDEVVRSLDELHADGVVLLASNAGVYLGQDGQVPVWTTFHRSPSTSCSIPPELRIYLCATGSAAGSRKSNSFSATPVDSSPTRRTEWPSPSWATPDAA